MFDGIVELSRTQAYPASLCMCYRGNTRLGGGGIDAPRRLVDAARFEQCAVQRRRLLLQRPRTAEHEPCLRTGMSIDICIDMFVGMCKDMRRDMCVDMCVDMCEDMRIDMHADMCMDMCATCVWTCIWTCVWACTQKYV